MSVLFSKRRIAGKDLMVRAGGIPVAEPAERPVHPHDAMQSLGTASNVVSESLESRDIEGQGDGICERDCTLRPSEVQLSTRFNDVLDRPNLDALPVAR